MACDDAPTAAVKRLLQWFERHARRLPWRTEPRDPYHVLVSELMLQQTQVDRVVPRFTSFVASYPSLEALAAAEEEQVLAAWSGLGYYRRARMLLRLARQVASGSGVLPSTVEELRELPGVGPYTAAAVASLAFGQAEPVLDGNVMRVASRVLASAAEPRSAAGREVLLAWLRRLLDHGPPGRVNEALMELGATVCRPVAPGCQRCPLAVDCRAAGLGRPEEYPPARPRRAPVALTWAAACCIDSRGRWLLRQVTDGPILVGLWLPPIGVVEPGESPEGVARRLVPGRLVEPPALLPAVRHAITHRRITVMPVRLRLAAEAETSVSGSWIDPDSGAIATSSLFGKIRQVSELAITRTSE